MRWVGKARTEKASAGETEAASARASAVCRIQVLVATRHTNASPRARRHPGAKHIGIGALATARAAGTRLATPFKQPNTSVEGVFTCATVGRTVIRILVGSRRECRSGVRTVRVLRSVLESPRARNGSVTA